MGVSPADLSISYRESTYLNIYLRGSVLYFKGKTLVILLLSSKDEKGVIYDEQIQW